MHAMAARARHHCGEITRSRVRESALPDTLSAFWACGIGRLGLSQRTPNPTIMQPERREFRLTACSFLAGQARVCCACSIGRLEAEMILGCSMRAAAPISVFILPFRAFERFHATLV